MNDTTATNTPAVPEPITLQLSVDWREYRPALSDMAWYIIKTDEKLLANVKKFCSDFQYHTEFVGNENLDIMSDPADPYFDFRVGTFMNKPNEAYDLTAFIGLKIGEQTYLFPVTVDLLEAGTLDQYHNLDVEYVEDAERIPTVVDFLCDTTDLGDHLE